jgi:hypothetical protein
MATATIPASIVHVYGVTCTTPECGFHESLHTADPAEAIRTARELGWHVNGSGAKCPLCVGATQSSNGNGHKSRRAGKAGAR